MTRILSYNFPAVNNSLSVICAEQNVLNGNKLALNGDFLEPITNTMSFKNRGYSRNVSFSSANDLHQVVFTIQGTENGVSFSEDVNGPLGGVNPPAYSVGTFDTITSILVGGVGNANAVSVGGGLLGYFGPLGGVLGGDAFPIWTVSVVGIDSGFAGTPQFSLFGSLNNLVNTDVYSELISRSIVVSYGQGNDHFDAPQHLSAFDTFNQLIVKLVLDDPTDGINFAYTNLGK